MLRPGEGIALGLARLLERLGRFEPERDDLEARAVSIERQRVANEERSEAFRFPSNHRKWARAYGFQRVGPAGSGSNGIGARGKCQSGGERKQYRFRHKSSPSSAFLTRRVQAPVTGISSRRRTPCHSAPT